MAWSRSTRISILLAIDLVFFFVEIIVGYAVGSLALIADSFHMLNDVLSLVVALYAIKVTGQEATNVYSYGKHRAEILAALINGVFLLALCFSICLEALERFFSTPNISNPRLVVIVGSLGLVSNIFGLVLFHEHTHSHHHSHHHNHAGSTSGDTTPTQKRSRSESFSSLYGHPTAIRAAVVQTAHDLASATSPVRSSGTSRPSLDEDDSSRQLPVDEETALLDQAKPHHHGHGHGSMNMHALVLHVIGDALGNVGVIATGLIIWFSGWSFKYYFDPIISLIITVIIFSSALPLVRSASFILLQGVPPSISLENVRDSILGVDGVLGCHDLHIWTLSEAKIIASVHVLASRSHDFMSVASKIREVLHHHGIHSSTIQPEYPRYSPSGEPIKGPAGACLIVCPPDGCNPQESSCCPPPVQV